MFKRDYVDMIFKLLLLLFLLLKAFEFILNNIFFV